MTDYSSFIKAPNEKGRYPFDRLTEIGDYFDVPVAQARVIRTYASRRMKNPDDKRLYVFQRDKGCRVILVDVLIKEVDI